MATSAIGMGVGQILCNFLILVIGLVAFVIIGGVIFINSNVSITLKIIEVFIGIVIFVSYVSLIKS